MANSRNYQDVIFSDFILQTVPFIPNGATYREHLVNIYLPAGDVYDKRACVIGLHGGGGDINSMRMWANDFTSRGYVFFVPAYKDSVGDFDLEKQISAIVNTACFIRWLKKNKGNYGVVGSKILGMGESAGGITIWQTAIALNDWADPMFASPINDLYPKAKQTILGSASMPGGVNKTIRGKINSGDTIHHDFHGDKDALISVEDSERAVSDMNKFGIGSTIRIFPGADHSLAGLHDIILKDTLEKFATLLGIPIVTPPAES